MIIEKASLITSPVIKESSQKESDLKAKLGNELIDQPLDLRTLKSINNSYNDRCINFKATSTVGLGFTIQKDGDTIDPDKHPEFIKSANPFESFHEVIIQVALDFEQCGTGDLEVVRNRKGDIAELYWVPTETIFVARKREYLEQIHLDSTQRVKFNFFGRKNIEANSEIIRFKMPSNKHPYYGFPEYIGAVGPIIMDAMAVEWNYRFFENNAIPDYAIIVEGGGFSKEAEKSIREFFTNNLKGVANARKTLYLPIAGKDVRVKFEEIMKRPQEGDFQKLREQIRDEIISVHGVPPRVLGIMTAGALGGSGETAGQLKIFKEVTVRPRQKLFESVINRTLLADTGFSIKFNELDVTAQHNDVTDIATLVSTGVLSEEEGREELQSQGVIKKESIRKSDDEAAKLLSQIIKLRSLLKDMA